MVVLRWLFCRPRTLITNKKALTYGVLLNGGSTLTYYEYKGINLRCHVKWWFYVDLSVDPELLLRTYGVLLNGGSTLTCYE